MKIPTINGKQVNLLLAFFIKAGIRGTIQQLEFIEYQCGVEVKRLEDLNNGQMNIVLNRLKKNYNLEAE